MGPSYNALELMQRQGGSFVKALAALYLAADPMNRKLALNTFRSYFETYQRRAEIEKVPK